MKRKYMIIFLTAALFLTACGGKDEGTEDSSKAQETETSAEEEAEQLLEYHPVLYEDLTSKILSLGEYKGLTAAENTEEVTDAQVRREIRERTRKYAVLTESDGPAQEGDVVLIDFTGYVDGETSDGLQGTEYSLEIGSGSFVPGFEEQLIGAQAGEDCQVNVTFPQSYYEELAGKNAEFQVHVHNVRAYEIEGWGDDFVKENLSYESVADMESSIRRELEEAAAQEAAANLEYDLISILLENSEYEIQETDVEAYIDEMLDEYRAYAAAANMELEAFLQSQVGVTEQQIRTLFRETAQFRVKMTLTFHEIAEREELSVSDEEYEQKVKELAEQYGYEDAAAVEAVYSPGMIREQMIQEKAISLIRENAVVE